MENSTKNPKKPKQKDASDAGSKTFSVKVSDWAWNFINAIAESREHGTNGNDLLKKCLQFVIECAKLDGPVPPQFQALTDMLKLDYGWHKAFNFGDPAARLDVAQVILVVQQQEGSGATGTTRHGLGLCMIDKPFMPGKAPTMTLCVDDILERVIELATPGNYRRLQWMSEHLETDTIRETITILADNTITETKRLELERELPGYDDRADNGRPIVFGERTKRKMRYEMDNMPTFFDLEGYQQQREEPPAGLDGAFDDKEP